jgi:hypothetical protein
MVPWSASAVIAARWLCSPQRARRLPVRNYLQPIPSGKHVMAINLFDSGGCPVERQRFTWNELAAKRYYRRHVDG